MHLIDGVEHAPTTQIAQKAMANQSTGGTGGGAGGDGNGGAVASIFLDGYERSRAKEQVRCRTQSVQFNSYGGTISGGLQYRSYRTSHSWQT